MIKKLKSTRAQEENLHLNKKISNLYLNKKWKSIKAQEEMVGFALIIIIVAVVILIFISFTIKDSGQEFVENYKVESFIQSFLQYTTDCGDNLEPTGVSLQKLIIDCRDGEICLDGRDTCEVLENTFKGITEKSWDLEKEIAGYELNITSETGEKILEFSAGNKTRNSQGSLQDLIRSGTIEILFTTYY